TLDKAAHPSSHPVMRDADAVLYRTTYQVGFDHAARSSVNRARFHYDESVRSTAAEYSPKINGKSVYESSYLDYRKVDTTGLGNPDRHRALTNLLWKSRCHGLTARDIVLGAGKIGGSTSYKRDFPPIRETYTSPAKDVVLPKLPQ
ncbi:hypothetical protein HDU91_000614, partial [Kappamyces sp. JEL0680]